MQLVVARSTETGIYLGKALRSSRTAQAWLEPNLYQLPHLFTMPIIWHKWPWYSAGQHYKTCVLRGT